MDTNNLENVDLSKMDKIDIELLYFMYSSQANTPMSSLQIKNILEATEWSISKVSYYTLVRRINNNLIPMGFVSEGYKVGNARTYYINECGTEYVQKNIVGNFGEVYEEVILNEDGGM